MYRHLIIFLFLSAAVVSARSQNLENISPTYISIKDGLPDATINAIGQDEDGFLWIGTNYGLSRYDGVEFKNFYHEQSGNSLPGNYINAIQILPGHRLLVATSTGLSLFNTQSNTFKNLLVQASAKMFPFENNFGKVKVDKQNNVWASSQTCLYKLDQHLNILQVERGLNEQEIGVRWFVYVEGIDPLPDGRVLFKLQQDNKIQHRIYTPDKNKITQLNQEKGTTLGMLDNLNIRDIAFDQKGNAWFVKHLVDSIFFLNTSTGNITSAPFDNMPGKGQIYFSSRITLVNNWLAACSLSDGGLMYWNRTAGGIKKGSVKSNLLLPSQHVICMFYDSENNLWIGTDNGLFKFALIANTVTTSILPGYNPASHRGISLSSTFVVNNKLFLTSTGGGLFYADADNTPWQAVLGNGIADANDTWNIRATGPNSYWIGTQTGIYEWNTTARQPYPLQQPAALSWLRDYPIVTQFTDSKNILWMGLGHGRGLAAYNLKTQSLKIYSKSDGKSYLPIRFPIAIDEDEHSDLWMGGVEGRGLLKWNRITEKFTLIPPLYNSAFDNGVITALYADHNGKLWIGTNSGLIKYDILRRTFKKYDVPAGLSSNAINALADDHNGHLWIGTKSGLNCMDTHTEHFFVFNGYYQSSEDPVQSVKYDAGTRKVYFNTDHTFYSISPDQWLRPRSAPKVLITSVTSSARNLNINENISLPANENNINISFTAVNLVDGTQNKYYYRLNELNKNWISVGKTRQITFSNLLSGKYSFSVKAQLSDGKMSINEANLLFTVATPYYKSWWFIFLIIAAIACVIYLIYLNRIRQLMHLQSIRNSIATDLHDDIGSTLSNINILTELSNSSINTPVKAQGFLKRITEEVNTSNQSLDDIVWSINTLNDSFDQIAARMRRYAAEIFEGANIAYHVSFDDDLSRKKLHMEKRKDIYMVFKEAVNNIYKHAEASTVEISLRADQSYFQMVIQDNGRGFDMTVPSARNGLKNMKIRISKWKGTLVISSAINQGTTLTVIMPLK